MFIGESWYFGGCGILVLSCRVVVLCCSRCCPGGEAIGVRVEREREGEREREVEGLR